MVIHPKVKRIGVLTSGGDAPGMNAAIRAVVRTAQCVGIDCVGIMHGYEGLLKGDFIPLTEAAVKGITGTGGTMLYTARSPEFGTEEGTERASIMCKNLGIEAVVVIGGDGSFQGAKRLSKYGTKVVGIPCTIDNDISCTSYSIGFDTACNTAVEAIDRLNDTMKSHERCSVVEVMGRKAGFLALNVGISTGATIILIPEMEYDFEKDVIERIRKARLAGRSNFGVIVAEGIKDSAYDVAEKIEKATGIESRLTNLGHIQRGGGPHVRDRVVATNMGYLAVMLLAAGESGKVIAMRGENYISLEINEALEMKKKLDPEQYKMFTVLTFMDKEVFGED